MLAGLGLLLLLSFTAWFGHDPTSDFEVLVPGMDGAPNALSGAPALEAASLRPVVVIGELFERGSGVPESRTLVAGSGAAVEHQVADLPWPQFRGPRSDNIATAAPALASAWPRDGPPVLWSTALGEGHAAPVVAHGSVYVLDYDEQARADTLRRLSLTDGTEIWKRYYRVPLKRNHGLSRTAPAVYGNFVVTIGPMCHVMGVHALSGDLLWSIDLPERYGTEVPLWYAGQNPLILDGTLFIAPGGTALMIGVDVASGTVLWETPNPGAWPMSHASVTPARLAGTDLLLLSTTEGAAAVALDGELLWTYAGWTAPVVVPSPVALPSGRAGRSDDDGMVFLSAGYGTGSMMLEVRRYGSTWEVSERYAFSSGGGLSSEQQTVLFVNDMLVGITPKDARNLRSRLVAMDPDGTLLWSALAEERLGLGPYLHADGKLYILKDDGTLLMGSISRDGFTLLDRAKLLDGTDAWAPMALAGSRLLLRDNRRLVCVDLR
jgi:outer membrane protein assembly factor BamB